MDDRAGSDDERAGDEEFIDEEEVQEYLHTDGQALSSAHSTVPTEPAHAILISISNSSCLQQAPEVPVSGC